MGTTPATTEMFKDLGKSQLVVRGKLLGPSSKSGQNLGCFLWLFTYWPEEDRYLVFNAVFYAVPGRDAFVGQTDTLLLKCLPLAEFETYLLSWQEGIFSSLYQERWLEPVKFLAAADGECAEVIVRPFTCPFISFCFGEMEALLSMWRKIWPEYNNMDGQYFIEVLQGRLWGFLLKNI